MSQIIGRDCDCEDFPCCGHGITLADIEEEQSTIGDWDWDEEFEEIE